MTADVPTLVAGAVGVAVILVLGKLALIPSNRLGVSVFHPYRDDPWPAGVQEDDDARFSWTRRPESSQPAAPEDPLDHVAARPPRPAPQDPAMPGFEEIAGPEVHAQPLASDGVHRAHR
jgi:hypothetical protein